MQKLLKGLTATARVVGIQEDFDQYEARKTEVGGLIHCHLTTFVLDGEEFRGQLCTPNQSVPYAVGDDIEITIKSFTREIYTFDLLSVYAKSEEENNKKPVQRPTLSILTGTPGEIALRLAVQHHANRPVGSTAEVFITANEFKEYLLNNTK